LGADNRLQLIQQLVVELPECFSEQEAEAGRELHALEQHEFEQWYELAEGFSLGRISIGTY
jgi:hypothetical protein